MSGERQEPRAQLSFETIHDRKDRDQRGDSEADSCQGNPADEGHEVLVLAGADVAEPKTQGQRGQHVR